MKLFPQDVKAAVRLEVCGGCQNCYGLAGSEWQKDKGWSVWFIWGGNCFSGEISGFDMDRGVELPVVNVTLIFRTLTWEREVLQVK